MFFNKVYTIYIFKRFLLVNQGGSISYLLYDDGFRGKTEAFVAFFEPPLDQLSFNLVEKSKS